MNHQLESIIIIINKYGPPIGINNNNNQLNYTIYGGALIGFKLNYIIYGGVSIEFKLN
jgi:hypothetical protein